MVLTRKRIVFATAGAAAVIAGCSLLASESATAARTQCSTTTEVPRYAAVKPIFVAHCAKCHDRAKGDNADAQAVFEMTRYPFTTERPDTLLRDLGHMFEERGGLSDAERCVSMSWLEGGALDDAGDKPPYKPFVKKH